MEEGWLWIPFREGVSAVSREVACREMSGSHAALKWVGKEVGGQQFLQSALNRAVLWLCDCQVGHYSLIRALFPPAALIGPSALLPSRAPSRCNQAPLSPHCHFHRCDFPTPIPPPAPSRRSPPQSLPIPPPAPRPPPTPSLQIRWVPIYSKEKRSCQTGCVNCKPPRFGLISMK